MVLERMAFPGVNNLKEHLIMSSHYPLTPPSSSEDSPTYFVASPSSNSFQGPLDGGYTPMSPSGVPVLTNFLQRGVFPPRGEMIVDLNVNAMDHSRGGGGGTYMKFIEQPVDKFRFRYKSEMAGTHGSLTGMRADRAKKQTYPTVQIKNCNLDQVMVRCSIYQINMNEEMPHAHRLIMKKGRDEVDDPHDLIVGPKEDYIATFHGMGIIHTAKKNIVSELVRKKSQLRLEKVAREEGGIRLLTPKEQAEIKGLAESESKSINLNIVCLRFDAYVQRNGILIPICDPVFSHGINNLKSALTGDLKIVRLDHCVSPAKGNKEIFIFVERVTKKNIKIRFFEQDDAGRVIWEDWGRFNDMDVHHQYAIVFKTPKYRDENITRPVKVSIELVRPSDNAHSECRDFRYIPNAHPYRPGTKRPRYMGASSSSSEYESSSNFDSGELPVVIDTLNLGMVQPLPPTQQLSPAPMDLSNLPSALSDELKRAMSNINSDEFSKLFMGLADEYTAISDDIGKDTPRDKTTKPYVNALPDLHIPEMSTLIKLEVSEQERKNAQTTLEELNSFMFAKNSTHRSDEIIDHYLAEPNKTNALHVFISQNNQRATDFFLKFLYYYKRLDILDIPNEDSKTPVHLAVMCRNLNLLGKLLKCKGKIGNVDADLNSALHLAVKHNDVEILQALLTDRGCERVEEYVDLKNCDGDTALTIAADKCNVEAVKMLCRAGADVNIFNDKTGFVPLRYAVERQNVQIVRHLLDLPQISPLIEDFSNLSPLEAALKKKNKQLTEIVQNYINENKVQMIFKEEPEDEDSEDDYEMMETKPILTNAELVSLYGDSIKLPVKHLLPICEILDKSGSWGCLSQLLNIDHLISSGIIHSETSMTEAVLTYAIETNKDSLWTIREFLESLDETRAVRILDTIVESFRSD